MPLEGQWERQHAALWPARGGERRTLLTLAGLLAVAVLIIVVLSLRAPGQSGAGCVALSVPSTTGAASFRTCGPDAVRLCRGQTPIPRDIAPAVRERCRAAGLP
jgi:hypothetical protein